MSYLFSCVPFLAGLAMIILGVTVVRKASPRAGFVFAAAGALELLAICCIRGIQAYSESEYGEGAAYYDYGSPAGDIMMISSVLSTLENVIAFVLIAVGFALLAKGSGPSRVS